MIDDDPLVDDEADAEETTLKEVLVVSAALAVLGLAAWKILELLETWL